MSEDYMGEYIEVTAPKEPGPVTIDTKAISAKLLKGEL